MVTDGSLENFGNNIIHIQTGSLQSLQTLQAFPYTSLSGRHSPSSAAAAAAAAYNTSDGYQYHQSGVGKLHQESHPYSSHHGVSTSGRLDSNAYSKIEGISSYKTALHGATAQVYSNIPSSSPNTVVYGDHTATLYSGSNPNHATITFNSNDGSGGAGSSIGPGIMIGSSQ